MVPSVMKQEAPPGARRTGRRVTTA